MVIADPISIPCSEKIFVLLKNKLNQFQIAACGVVLVCIIVLYSKDIQHDKASPNAHKDFDLSCPSSQEWQETTVFPNFQPMTTKINILCAL